VDWFGWTLGGVYLARYDDSPVGAFDEVRVLVHNSNHAMLSGFWGCSRAGVGSWAYISPTNLSVSTSRTRPQRSPTPLDPNQTAQQCVVMAGLVWNAPLSCAWAGRVYVSNKEARDHGLAHVGLPSRLARFDGAGAPQPSVRDERRAEARSWWRAGRAPALLPLAHPASLGVKLGGGWVDAVELRSVERGRRAMGRPVATFKLPGMRVEGFLGPRLRLSLPSFSGGTAEQPELLKYSCDLQTDVMPVGSMQIDLHHSDLDTSSSGASGSASGSGSGSSKQQQGRWWLWGRQQQQQQRQRQEEGGEGIDALLCGRPLVTLAFSNMVVSC